MKKSGSFIGLVVVVVIGYMILSKMAPDYREVSSIREDNGLVYMLSDNGLVYQADEPHAVYKEEVTKKFSFWRWKYRYEVRYIPFVDGDGNHMTYDSDTHIWGHLDGVIYLDDMN